MTLEQILLAGNEQLNQQHIELLRNNWNTIDQILVQSGHVPRFKPPRQVQQIDDEIDWATFFSEDYIADHYNNICNHSLYQVHN